jgi:O-antigen polymerase
LALAGVFFLYALFRLKPWGATHPMERLCWGVLAMLGVHSLLEYPLWFGVFQVMALLAAWQIYRIRLQSAAGAAASSSPPLPAPIRLSVSALLLAGLSFVAWDYLKVSQLYLPTSQRMERYRVDTFNKVRGAVLFQSHVLIAQVVAVEPTPDNAELMLAGALASLHVAPDPRLIRRVIQAAAVLGRTDLVQLHEARYKAAWPREYAAWKRDPAEKPF